jgi:hypothetical protein
MKYILVTIFFLSSCSSGVLSLWESKKPIEVELAGYKLYTEDDFINQLKSFKDIFLEENKSKLIKLNYSQKKYLKEIIQTLKDNNELFFKNTDIPEFFIIDSDKPFHFSTPGYKFFLSTGLMRKYIKSEQILFCILAYELIRSEKNIYTKRILIPTRVMSIERILSLQRLSIKDKSEIHKWAYYVLRRTNSNTDSYLSWLQIKNRNSIDFTLQLGEVRSISEEEAIFKAFLIENKKKQTKKYKGSSRDFYNLLRVVKRKI